MKDITKDIRPKYFIKSSMYFSEKGELHTKIFYKRHPYQFLIGITHTDIDVNVRDRAGILSKTGILSKNEYVLSKRRKKKQSKVLLFGDLILEIAVDSMNLYVPYRDLPLVQARRKSVRSLPEIERLVYYRHKLEEIINVLTTFPNEFYP